MKEPKVENKLRMIGCEFRYHATIPFVEIDIAGAQNNPARYGKRIDPERVESMVVALRNGAELPAIVVCRIDVPGLYKYNLGEGSGLHRVLAYRKCGIDKCDAYVVSEPDANMRRRLPMLLNSIEGMTNSLRDRYAAIFDMVTRKAGEVTALCIAFSVRKDNYLAFERLEKTKARLTRLGWATDGRFTNDHLKELNKIVSDRVLSAVAGFVANYKVSLAALQDLVRDLEASPVKSEEAWLAIVTDHVTKIAALRAQHDNQKARMRPAAEKWCDLLHSAVNLYKRENFAVLDGESIRLDACINDGLNMLKILKGEFVRRSRFKATA